MAIKNHPTKNSPYSTIIDLGFLFLPKRVGDQTRWWCKAKVKAVLRRNGDDEYGNSTWHYQPVEFVD